MDELDTQLMAELESQKEAPATQEGQEPVTTPAENQTPVEELKQEPKMYDETIVKALRAENAKYRVRAREAEERLYNQGMQSQSQEYPQAGQIPQGPIYDPRVDDIILNSKLNEIKADPYFGELFNEVDEEGITFEERLLEKALELQWPVSELDALVFKMEKNKLLGKVKQKGIDEAYKSISSKAQNSVDKSVSSGKNIENSEVNSVDDAVARAMKELGVTDITKLR